MRTPSRVAIRRRACRMCSATKSRSAAVPCYQPMKRTTAPPPNNACRSSSHDNPRREQICRAVSAFVCARHVGAGTVELRLLERRRRLERAELDNPPLRHLVNCMLVLRSRLPDIRLSDVIEPQWLEWLAFSAGAPAPLQPPKPEKYKFFPD